MQINSCQTYSPNIFIRDQIAIPLANAQLEHD